MGRFFVSASLYSDRRFLRVLHVLLDLVRFAHIARALPVRPPRGLPQGAIRVLAGSPATFREVDHGHVLAAARLARAAGTPTFALNSSLGASAGSGNLYLRTKGETEDDLAALGSASVTLVRPSLLDGGPRPDTRPGEAVGLWLFRLARPLIPARYRAVRTEAVARALLTAVQQAKLGRWCVENAEISAR